MTAPRLADQIRLVATRPAINCAGLFVVYTLNKWGARAILPDAVRATEELVTSAVRQTGVLDNLPRLTEAARLNFITVRLLGLPSSIVIEVWDRDPETPTHPYPTGSVTNIGAYRSGEGKVVWVELTLLPRPHNDPGLPHRIRDGHG